MPRLERNDARTARDALADRPRKSARYATRYTDIVPAKLSALTDGSADKHGDDQANANANGDATRAVSDAHPNWLAHAAWGQRSTPSARFAEPLPRKSSQYPIKLVGVWVDDDYEMTALHSGTEYAAA